MPSGTLCLLFMKKEKRDRSCLLVYRPRNSGPKPTAAERATQLVLFCPSCISAEHGHFHKSQYQSVLSQIYIRKPIIITGSVIWPISCRRITSNCIVNGKVYAEATVLH